MATKTYKGRTSALTGNAEDVPVATLKTDLVLVKGDVGLGNVDNTSDANKPVSTAQQTAIDAKVADAITDGVTTIAPSQNAVFDALALKSNTSHTHLLAAGATDVTITAANLNSLDDGVDSTLHFHATDRARANHTGSQLASTISDFASAVIAQVLTGLSVATGTAVAATDSILVAIGKLQKQNTDQDTTIAAKVASVSAGTNVTVTGTATAPIVNTPTMTATVGGAVPTPPNNTTTFLRGDGTFAAPSSGFADPLTTNGDIIARVAGATTRLAQGSNGTFLGVSGGALGYYTPAGGSGITRSVNNISTTTTGAAVASTDYEYNCTGTFTFTLPTAVGNTNQYTIARVTGTPTIACTGAETIQGRTTIPLQVDGMSLTVTSNGTNWTIK